MRGKLPPEVMRQRRALAPATVDFAIQASAPAPQVKPARSYDTSNRPRTSPKTSGSQDPRYGSYRWKKLRAKVLRERPQCEGGCKGYFKSAYVDHIIEVRYDTSDENFFDEGNLQALCAQDHARKTQAEKARRAGRKYKPPTAYSGVEIGADGLPVPGSPHWWND